MSPSHDPNDFVAIDTINGPAVVRPYEVAGASRFRPKSASSAPSNKPQLILALKGGNSMYCLDSRKNCERLFGAKLALALEPVGGRKGSRKAKVAAVPHSERGEAADQP